MKIKPQDYRVLKKAMFKVLDANPNMEEEYKRRGLTDKRFRWDVLWRTKLKLGQTPGTPGDLNLYDYADDRHIDTALKSIITEYKKKHSAKVIAGIKRRIHVFQKLNKD